MLVFYAVSVHMQRQLSGACGKFALLRPERELFVPQSGDIVDGFEELLNPMCGRLVQLTEEELFMHIASSWISHMDAMPRTYKPRAAPALVVSEMEVVKDVVCEHFDECAIGSSLKDAVVGWHAPAVAKKCEIEDGRDFWGPASKQASRSSTPPSRDLEALDPDMNCMRELVSDFLGVEAPALRDF